MPLYSLSMRVPQAAAEAVADLLLETGALSIDVQDARSGSAHERPIFREPNDPGSQGANAWEVNVLEALFERTQVAPESALARAYAALNALSLVETPLLRDVADQDWVRLTQAQFEPISITDSFWIVPTWQSLPAAAKNQSAHQMRLDPGLAFGTGSHPTTQLCLRWLLGQDLTARSVMDYGCGSGVLAIAAAMRGAGFTLGVDIDPQAVETSRQNALQNHVQAEFQVSTEPLAPSRQQFDVVVANILTNPLRVLAPVIGRLPKPGCALGLSGVLCEQADDVIAAYAPFATLQAVADLDGWVLLAGPRR